MKTSSTPALPIQPAPAASSGLPQLRLVSIILWAVAILQIVAGIVLVVRGPEEIDGMLQSLLDGQRISLLEAKSAPPEKRVIFDQVRNALITKVRLWHSCNILSGVVAIACAWAARRRPLRSASIALGAFFAASAMSMGFYPYYPRWFLLMFTARVLVLNVLVYAVAVGFMHWKAQKKTEKIVA